MMRSLQIESQHRNRPTWLWCMALLCMAVLFFASTAQACHAHGTLLHPAGEKAQISAPVDECPLCAAPHAAVVAESRMSVAGTLEAEAVLPAQTIRPFRARCAFDLFSRPPPARLRVKC